MKIQYIEGDLLVTDVKRVIQGVNARGVMASGCAKAIRDKYPEAYKGYRSAYERQHHSLELSQIVWVPTKDGKHVIGNMVTQDDYGRRPGVVYASYHAIEIGMMRLDSYMEGTMEGKDGPLPRVAMPAIGAGLAQGDWPTIVEIIERCAAHFQPVVYLLDGKIPEGNNRRKIAQ